MGDSVKRLMVGTSLGRWASSVRDVLTLVRTPLVALGTTVNDQLALRLLAQLCRKGETFVDIGAHIGSVIAEVRHWCPEAQIVAFEAIPEKAESLRRKFPNVTVHSCALSDSDGDTVFYVDTRESGYSSLQERPGRSRQIRIQMRRLDAIVTKADWIKLDVEGAELGVLRGAENLIGRCKPVIMFESGPGEVLGYTKEQIFSWLTERNYGLMAPNRIAHTGGAMTLDGFLDSHEYPRRTTNYFAVPMDRFEEIRSRARSVSIKRI